MNEPQTSLFSSDKKLTFIALCLTSVLLLAIKKYFIEFETAAFEFLQDRPEGMVLKMISALQFFSIPFIYLWKFTVIGFVLWVGCFLFGYRITFSQCWSVAMAAEFVFVLPELIKIGWFLFIKTDPPLAEVQSFYPLSLMNFFDGYSIDRRYAYPLRALSVFEILYVLVLVRGVNFYSFHTHKQQSSTWWIVSCSYILIFLLWLVFYIVVYK
ncbi:MAG: hypothetical protein OJF59_000936 [Cytophagales bacterium]|jgi:hypothetical protein|nr:hypothetical protein [Bacteroidota bacterium]WHZ07183.1 MAG: hypothetical protein OJF59_000936 [Cytophagales bacterium]